MSDDKERMGDEARVALAQRMIAERPQHVREQYREAILSGIVTLGMTPFEAKLAGGGFAYKVQPDPTRWPSNANPLAVIFAQSEQPDASYIRMTFRTDTQFPGAGTRAFHVVFKQGAAQEIVQEGT
ncbi:hypothetical protein [Peristeroidobacter agariperforans]|uniref:hypothetical protein n=1 Tax=Peristeroidobacter agariperforans TaxID=268404 RepID=UPI0018E52E77|nr:hypothetical protein [Peristeroidobacter agariperforans]